MAKPKEGIVFQIFAERNNFLSVLLYFSKSRYDTFAVVYSFQDKVFTA